MCTPDVTHYIVVLVLVPLNPNNRGVELYQDQPKSLYVTNNIILNKKNACNLGDLLRPRAD